MFRKSDTQQQLLIVSALHAVVVLLFMADWMWFEQVCRQLPTVGSIEVGQLIYWVVFTSSLPLTFTWVHWAWSVRKDRFLLSVVISVCFTFWWQWSVFATHGLGLVTMAQFLSRVGTGGAFFIGLGWVIWLVDEESFRLEQSRPRVDRPDLGKDLARVLIWGLLFPPLLLLWARRRPRPIRRTALAVLCLAAFLWGGFVIYPAYLIASTRQAAAAVDAYLCYLPAEANAVASVNVAQLREYEPFQEQFSQLKTAVSEEGDVKTSFEAFKEQLGFDPIVQFEAIDFLQVGAVLTENGGSRQTVFVLHSAAGFDIEAIAAACSHDDYLEKTIFTPNGELWRGLALYFPTPQMLVAGRDAAVKAAVVQDEQHPHRPALTFIDFNQPFVVATTSSYENAPGRLRRLPYLSDTATYSNLSDALSTGLDAFALSSSLSEPLSVGFEAECVGLNTSKYIEANLLRLQREMLKLFADIRAEHEKPSEEEANTTPADADNESKPGDGEARTPAARVPDGESATPPAEPKNQPIPEIDDDLLGEPKPKGKAEPGPTVLPGETEDPSADGETKSNRKVDLSSLGLLDEPDKSAAGNESEEQPLNPAVPLLEQFFNDMQVSRNGTEVSLTASVPNETFDKLVKPTFERRFGGDEQNDLFNNIQEVLAKWGLVAEPPKPEVEEVATAEGASSKEGEAAEPAKEGKTEKPAAEPVAEAKPPAPEKSEAAKPKPAPNTAALLVMEFRRMGDWYSKILSRRVRPQMVFVVLASLAVTLAAGLLWAGERHLRRTLLPARAMAGGMVDRRWWLEEPEQDQFLWNPFDVEAWYYGRRSPKLNQSLSTFLSYTFLFMLMFFIITNAGGCQEIYEMPAGGGEQAQLQQTVKIQKIIRKKFVVNPFSAISFRIPPIDDVQLQLNEITKHAYTVGYGQGDGAGFAGGTNVGKVRFIRLEYQGGDWDQDFGIGADLNMLLEYGIRTKHKVSDKTESRAILQLKNFPIGKSPPFVFMTGQKNIVVSKNEIAAMREYLLEKHGMLFCDNGGSGQFHSQFVAFMRSVLPNVQPVSVPLDDLIHRVPYPIPFLPYVAPHGGKEALGWKVDGRWVCYYHPGDIGDAWSDGHAGVSREIYEACFQLGTNVIFYAHTEYSKWLQAREKNK